ncbi:hypothetical protein ATANTOWER_009199 [Ataeniobius toweri]|uniref:Uncharacterized protein n=1 Tax=Ataeniobius toweri TaxID=208326 RepID=A0ABU7AE44_9TELE|nr:hypothetical protein [Ataeniobius toweri]
MCPISACLSVCRSVRLSERRLVFGSAMKECVRFSVIMCGSLSASGWGILSCFVLSKAECSGSRERERLEGGETARQLGCCQGASLGGLDSACSRQTASFRVVHFPFQVVLSLHISL